jgi:hypothetical protein
MTICTPIETDWHIPGQAIIVLDDPAMVRRGLAGREGVIDHLSGGDAPGMAVVELKQESSPEDSTWATLPLASLRPVRRTRLPNASG